MKYSMWRVRFFFFNNSFIFLKITATKKSVPFTKQLDARRNIDFRKEL